MRKLFLSAFSLMLCATLLNCAGKEGDEKTGTEEATEETVDKSEEVVEEPTEPNAVSLWPVAISIRSEADPKSKYVAAMYLGEKVFYAGEDKVFDSEGREQTYAKIKLQDGTEGWTRKDFLAVDASPVAVLKEATVYKRPDLLTKTDKKFNRMDVIAVISEKDDWVEVKGKKGTWFVEGWIKKGNITSEQIDVVVATYYTKAQTMKEDKMAKEMKSLIENDDLAGSIFMSEIREEVMTPKEEIPMPDEDMEEDEGEGDM